MELEVEVASKQVEFGPRGFGRPDLDMCLGKTEGRGLLTC